jgi:hypothetical protein
MINSFLGLQASFARLRVSDFRGNADAPAWRTTDPRAGYSGASSQPWNSSTRTPPLQRREANAARISVEKSSAAAPTSRPRATKRV